MKTNVSELSGKQLDIAVANADNVAFKIDKYNDPMIETFNALGQCDGVQLFTPSNNWEQVGPIIEREGITLRRNKNIWYAMAEKDCGTGETVRWSKQTIVGGERYGVLSYQLHKRIQRFEGETALIAAMRCYVAIRPKNPEKTS